MRLLIGALVFFASVSFANESDEREKLRCETLLDKTSILRYFRNNGDFVETRDGFWIQRGTQMAFVDKTGVAVRSRMGNNASHLEIIRRQIGEARFNEIMSSPSSGDELDRLMKQIAIAAENPENIREAEELYAEIEDVPASQPLSPEMEVHVLTLLKKMERLAMPLSDWLRPKIQENRLNQLPASSFDHPQIERRIKPNVRVFKASKVKVLLNKERSFIISSGRYELPDNLHSVAQDILNRILPKVRFFNRTQAIPGYLIVHSTNGDFSKGRIEFIRKGDMIVEDVEDYDFSN